MRLGTQQIDILQKTVEAHARLGRPVKAADIGMPMAAQRGRVYQVWNGLAKHGLVIRNGRDGTVPTPLAATVLSGYRRPPRTENRKLFQYRVVPETATRTAWPAQVVDVGLRIPFQPGDNSDKLGAKVLRGRWKGFPIYSLTLEERATCPRSCANWCNCYGNGSSRAIRFKHGPQLERAIKQGVADLARRYPAGFVIRLHQLGDFYSMAYVEVWRDLLAMHRPLNVFGYTAHDPFNDMGKLIRSVRSEFPGRFQIRHSNSSIKFAATTIHRKPEAVKIPEGYVCLEQLGARQTCGACTICWEADNTPIVFIDHAFL